MLGSGGAESALR